LTGAIEIIQSILQQANASIAREEREDALLDLSDRVEDWKSLRMDTFGELMLFGTFSVLKGDGGGKDQEKEVGSPSSRNFWLAPSVSVFSLTGKVNTFQSIAIKVGRLTVSISVPHLPFPTYSSLLQGYELE
jgi:hypothetical protein